MKIEHITSNFPHNTHIHIRRERRLGGTSLLTREKPSFFARVYDDNKNPRGFGLFPRPGPAFPGKRPFGKAGRSGKDHRKTGETAGPLLFPEESDTLRIDTRIRRPCVLHNFFLFTYGKVSNRFGRVRTNGCSMCWA